MLRAFIRKTILADIRSANLRSKNHKLNRAVQAMLFGMVERGMDGEVLGDRGKLRAAAGPTAERSAHNGDEAMWAVVLTKELWKKGIWYATALGKSKEVANTLQERHQDRLHRRPRLLPPRHESTERLRPLLPRQRRRRRGGR